MSHQASYARLASARAALHTVKSSSCSWEAVIARRRYPRRARSNLRIPVRPGALLAGAADEQHAHHDHQRERVEHVDDHVPGVRVQGHVLSAAERSQSPRIVNSTITTSMTI